MTDEPDADVGVNPPPSELDDETGALDEPFEDDPTDEPQEGEP